jgi:hypothetical protein
MKKVSIKIVQFLHSEKVIGITLIFSIISFFAGAIAYFMGFEAISDVLIIPLIALIVYSGLIFPVMMLLQIKNEKDTAEKNRLRWSAYFLSLVPGLVILFLIDGFVPIPSSMWNLLISLAIGIIYTHSVKKISQKMATRCSLA